jgi:hypothetical protein
MHAMALREDVVEVTLPGTSQHLVVSRSYRGWSLRVRDEHGRTVARCRLRSRTGEFDGVFAAPDGSVVAVRWNDQAEAGLVLVQLRGELRQLPAAWDTRETNWLEGPTWTADSELLVLVENPAGAGPWWAELDDRDDADDDDVSPGGTFSPGSILVLDRNLVERSRQLVRVELPAGWYPSTDADRGIGIPQVISPDEAVVRVPVQGERRITLRDT